MLQQLQELFNQYTGKTDIVLRKDSMILRDLGMNSYELVTLVCQVEDYFNIEIPDRKIAKLRTIGDFIQLLDEAKA